MMTHEAEELAGRVRSLRLPADRTTTVIDLSGIESLAEPDALALIRAERRFRANGRELVVVHTSHAVRRQLVALGLLSLVRRPRP
ncbi:MAG: STAS domain-containing protein [Microthrixaceae bacterium]